MSDKFKDVLIAVLIAFLLISHFTMLIYILTRAREEPTTPPCTPTEVSDVQRPYFD